MKNVYLDVCCLNRPFDDQTQNRVHLESEAILTILSLCETGSWVLVASEVTEFEIMAIPDYDRREKVLSLAQLADEIIKLNEAISDRAGTIMNMGFTTYDALHLACAEYVSANIFLTTDDKLMTRAKKNSNLLRVRVANPVVWLMEVIQNGEDDDS